MLGRHSAGGERPAVPAPPALLMRPPRLPAHRCARPQPLALHFSEARGEECVPPELWTRQLTHSAAPISPSARPTTHSTHLAHLGGEGAAGAWHTKKTRANSSTKPQHRPAQPTHLAHLEGEGAGQLGRHAAHHLLHAPRAQQARRPRALAAPRRGGVATADVSDSGACRASGRALPTAGTPAQRAPLPRHGGAAAWRACGRGVRRAGVCGQRPAAVGAARRGATTGRAAPACRHRPGRPYRLIVPFFKKN